MRADKREGATVQVQLQPELPPSYGRLAVSEMELEAINVSGSFLQPPTLTSLASLLFTERRSKCSQSIITIKINNTKVKGRVCAQWILIGPVAWVWWEGW